MNKYNFSKIKDYSTNLNKTYTAFLASELIEYYKCNEDKVNNLTLREISQITDLLQKYILKISIECIFTDCNYESTAENALCHLFTCKKSPKETVTIVNKLDDKKYIDLKNKYIKLETLRPFQVDYYQSLTESYLKENRFIESTAPKNLKIFNEFKNINEWKLKVDTHSYQLFQMQTDIEIVKNSNYIFNNIIKHKDCIKTSIMINSNIKKVFYFLDNPENYSIYMKKIHEDSYTIRQINSNTRLFYLKVKPGFNYTDFICIQQVLMSQKSLLILRVSLDEDESPNKYMYPKSNYVEIRRGYVHIDSFNISNVDENTCNLTHYICIDYKLNENHEETLKQITQESTNIVKVIKNHVENNK